jgi:hypothetical protein
LGEAFGFALKAIPDAKLCLGVWMEVIERQFAFGPDGDDEAGGKSNGEARHVEDCRHFVFGEVSQGSGEDGFEHRLRWNRLPITLEYRASLGNDKIRAFRLLSCSMVSQERSFPGAILALPPGIGPEKKNAPS